MATQQEIMKPRVAIVVVTYNRLNLLMDCLSALLNQDESFERLIVVDNCSTDGTRDWLASWSDEQGELVQHFLLEENSGGAGGFSSGLDIATKNGADWVWMMDDDAVPEPDALGQLLKVADDPQNIYGSLAVSGEQTAWLTTLVDEQCRVATSAGDVPAKARVQSLPFLGFLIHRKLVQSIGLPDPGFFIAADDVEYCVRAVNHGADIFIAGHSRIEHPASVPYPFKFFSIRLTCLRLPPWKRYYDTRNRLLIAKKHFGARLIIETIPGSFLRLVAALIHEPDKLKQTWAFLAGFWDGLWGTKGRRHEKWGILP
ncbi:glycosyltransferase [Halioglobus maricola]|uniref:Glycosyltransferase n=1 Tax=Halioglobus maricola TaxID=2601894 RepID=A0A5P9NI61_9GAMM|nr:glycosyltransferase [Halioglobus maricola]QFU74688.1 glycosyltransferase [Halioglobus maricola]